MAWGEEFFLLTYTLMVACHHVQNSMLKLRKVIQCQFLIKTYGAGFLLEGANYTYTILS